MNFKKNPIKREKIILSLLSLIVLLQACQQKADQKAEKLNVLVGQWEAEWQTKVNESIHSMNGEMRFAENGTVAVQAYGYNGCYFMSDTSKNEMVWQLDGDTLLLQIPDDNFSFAYRIKNLNSDQAHLTLLEDINLHLRKTN
jgi:hypothetical protein